MNLSSFISKTEKIVIVKDKIVIVKDVLSELTNITKLIIEPKLLVQRNHRDFGVFNGFLQIGSRCYFISITLFDLLEVILLFLYHPLIVDQVILFALVIVFVTSILLVKIC